jgi:uncharacterized membrane protein YciS (DUF1049 family)
MRFIKVLVIILLFFVALLFFAQNTEQLSQTVVLKFNLYLATWKTLPLPFYFLILLGFLVGAVVCLIYFLVDKVRMTKDLKHWKGKAQRLEQEVNSLRNLPLEGHSYPGSEADENEG